MRLESFEAAMESQRVLQEGAHVLPIVCQFCGRVTDMQARDFDAEYATARWLQCEIWTLARHKALCAR